MFPVVAYFPTFVFDFPERIYLTDRLNTKSNTFYKRLFQDILNYDDRGWTIEKHIIDRLRKPEYISPWAVFYTQWFASNDRDKIDQVMARASQIVTKVVFGRWNEVFDEDAKNKEIEIEWGLEEGEDEDEEGNPIPGDEHDIYIKFRIKHGTQKFDIKDRSLGFRWFFTFLLFTQFRAMRDEGRPIIFLFDEPASNLHAAAQQKLVESFPEIAQSPHLFIYSTHSHYMIEPKWLEQAYIVQNDASSESETLIDGAIKDDESINITVTPYKKFLALNPSNISYFQPIIDRLEVIPSKFDIDRGGVILEGKSDYYIIRYISEILFGEKLRLFPALGAGTMNALISINKGWGLPVRIILDSDSAGQKEAESYMEKFFLEDKEITLLNRLLPEISEIEDLLADDDKSIIAHELDTNKPSKKQILRFFQQKLAANINVKFSDQFMTGGKTLIEAIKKFGLV